MSGPLSCKVGTPLCGPPSLGFGLAKPSNDRSASRRTVPYQPLLTAVYNGHLGDPARSVWNGDAASQDRPNRVPWPNPCRTSGMDRYAFSSTPVMFHVSRPYLPVWVNCMCGTACLAFAPVRGPCNREGFGDHVPNFRGRLPRSPERIKAHYPL